MLRLVYQGDVLVLYDPASGSFSSAAVTIALREFVAPICTAGLNMTLLGVGGCP